MPASLVSILHGVLLLMILSLSGCSVFSGPSIETPDIHLQSVRFKGGNVLEQEFRLNFMIKNPNPFNLSVRGLSYQVQLNELDLFKGESTHDFVVPAHGSTVFSLLAHSNLWRHLRQLRQMLESPQRPVRYRFDGEVKTGPIFGESIPLHRSGEFLPAAR